MMMLKSTLGNRIQILLTCVVLAGAPSFAKAGDSEFKDGDISRWVENALSHDARIESAQIKVSTADGIVTLNGNVSTIAAQTFASREAKRIRGVKGVTNEIKVTPAQRMDFDIRQDVRRRILNNSTIKSQNLQVLCHDGSVSLVGEVASHAEELEAELVASEVIGVRDVQNHLLTAYTTKSGDEDIRRDVKATINRDVYLSGLKITVAVKSGVVSLDGFVSADWEKSRAADDVLKLSHVKSVENNLQVDAILDQSSRQPAVWETEEELEDEVQAELSQDGRLNAADVSVEVEYGHVTLYGTVNTHREQRIAEQDARNVVGVVWVSNNLQLNGPEREDARTFEDVRFELVSDAMLHAFRITPEVAHGTVTLTGSVHNAYQKQHAEDVAGRVHGVRDIINSIRVERDTRYSDASLKSAISNRLKWNYSTSLSAKSINITVTNGIAVLNGACDTWAVRKEAERVAFNTEGIWQVRNNLIVTGFEYPWDSWKQNDEVYDFDPFFYRLRGYE